MRVVYIAGPYRSDCENGVFENIIKAREVAVKLWEKGYAVICPHTNSFFMGSRLGDDKFLKGDLEILERCDIIYMLSNWQESKGARLEFEKAKELGIEILFEKGI